MVRLRARQSNHEGRQSKSLDTFQTCVVRLQEDMPDGVRSGVEDGIAHARVCLEGLKHEKSTTKLLTQ